MAVDGAKVMRVMMWEAIKRRMPQGLARALKRQRKDARAAGGVKRRRDQSGSGEGGRRLAMRAGSPICSHV